MQMILIFSVMLLAVAGCSQKEMTGTEIKSVQQSKLDEQKATTDGIHSSLIVGDLAKLLQGNWAATRYHHIPTDHSSSTRKSVSTINIDFNKGWSIENGNVLVDTNREHNEYQVSRYYIISNASANRAELLETWTSDHIILIKQ